MSEYPLNPLLTNVAWQKNKGMYSKMAGSTGLGAALTGMNSAYKAVDWEFIGMMPIMKKDEVRSWGKAKVLERQRFSKKNCQKAAVFEKSLQTVIDKAKATDAQFRASKLPNIATGKKAAADVLKAANDMMSEFNKHPYKLTYNQWDDFVTRFTSDLK